MSINNIELAIKIHGELSRLIRPATAESIRASKIRNNPTLIGIIISGIASFVLFVIPLISDVLPSFSQIIGAAGLGITFNSLYTANKYLQTSTYNPKYNQSYIINYALGLFAGSILGLFGKELFPGKNGALNLQPNILALIGGFSAEAVAQVLQRIADTLVTMIKGTTKERSQAQADKKINEATTKLASQLTNAVDDDLAKTKNNIEKLIQDLLEKR